MKRKWLSLMLALAMVTSLLSGCGGGNSESGGTGEQSPDAAPSSTVQNTIFNGELEQNITIRVLENDTVIAKGYFAELIDAFNEAYADYGIVAVDANMDQYLDLANDGPYGYGPDVLYQANDIIMQYAEGLIHQRFHDSVGNRVLPVEGLEARIVGVIHLVPIYAL